MITRGKKMAGICINKDATFDISEEERKTLKNARDILEEIRHEWFLKDDDAWDHEEYGELEAAVDALNDILNFD